MARAVPHRTHRTRERSNLPRLPSVPFARMRPSGRRCAASPALSAARLAIVFLAGMGGPGGLPAAAGAPLPVSRPAELADPPGREVPLPVPRPEEAGPALSTGPDRDVHAPAPPPPPGHEAFGPPLPKASNREAFGPPLPARPVDPLAPPEPDGACGPLLSSGKVVARMEAPIPGQDGCGIAAPVMLEAVVSTTGRRIALSPPAVMRCDFADRFADWLRDDVATASPSGGELVGIDDAAAYTCRHRNWQAGSRISEHARGNAIDVLAFRFARRVVGIKGSEDAVTLASLRGSACSRFSTVLGPGSDAYHATDLHLDLQRRRNGYKLCQWAVP